MALSPLHEGGCSLDMLCQRLYISGTERASELSSTPFMQSSARNYRNCNGLPHAVPNPDLREVQLPFWDQRARTMCCGCVTHPRVRSHTKPVAHFGCTFGLSSGLWCITVAAPRVACRPTIPTGGRQMWSEACTILHSLRLGSITIESGCIPKLKGALVRWAMWLLPGMTQRGDA